MATQLPSMPIQNPTIPELDPDNIIPWIMSIKFDADTLQTTSQIEDTNYNFYPVHHLFFSALVSFIISSLQKTVASFVLTPGTPRNHFLIISRFQKNLEPTSTSDHDTLQTKEENTLIPNF